MQRGLIGALIGGLIGGLIWFCIGYFAEVSIGIIAWGVGALVGTGMLLTKRGAPAAASGWASAGIAVLALFLAKFAIVDTVIHKKLATSFSIDREFILVGFANDFASEAQDAGKTLEWPAGMNYDNAEKPEHYPADIWKQAEEKWASISEDEQKEMIESANEALQDAQSASMASIRWEVFSNRIRRLISFGLCWR